jgi:outer membrane protein
MKKGLWLSLLFLGLMIASPALAAREATVKDTQKQMKIGIVDMQKILRESKAANAARASFLKDVEAKKARIIAKATELQKLEEELNRMDATTPLETRRQKTDKLKHDGRELKNLQQDMEEEAKRKEMEMAQKLFGEIMQIVRNFAKSERYSLILERGTIITAEESIDITDRILKIYDGQKK